MLLEPVPFESKQQFPGRTPSPCVHMSLVSVRPSVPGASQLLFLKLAGPILSGTRGHRDEGYVQGSYKVVILYRYKSTLIFIYIAILFFLFSGRH